MTGSLGPDTRGVSEQAGVAALIALTVLATVSVGAGVLFADDDPGTIEANFTYQYQPDSFAVFVTFAGGDDLRAGNLTVAGPANNVSWATLASANETATLAAGETVVLGPQTAYGSRVEEGDTVRLRYVRPDGNVTVLDSWSSESDSSP